MKPSRNQRRRQRRKQDRQAANTINVTTNTPTLTSPTIASGEWQQVKPKRSKPMSLRDLPSGSYVPAKEESALLMVVRMGVTALPLAMRQELWPLLVRLNRRTRCTAIGCRALLGRGDWTHPICGKTRRPSKSREWIWHPFWSMARATPYSHRGNVTHPFFSLNQRQSAWEYPPTTAARDADQAPLDLSRLAFHPRKLELSSAAQARERLHFQMATLFRPSALHPHQNPTGDFPQIKWLPFDCVRALASAPACSANPEYAHQLTQFLRLLSLHSCDSGTADLETRKKHWRHQMAVWSPVHDHHPTLTARALSTLTPHQERVKLKSQWIDDDDFDISMMGWIHHEWVAGQPPQELGRHPSRSANLYWFAFDARLEDEWPAVPLCMPLRREWRDTVLLLTAVSWPWSRQTEDQRAEALRLMMDPTVTEGPWMHTSDFHFRTRMGGQATWRRLLRHLAWMTFNHHTPPSVVMSINRLMHRLLDEDSFLWKSFRRTNTNPSVGLGLENLPHQGAVCRNWCYVLWFLHHADDGLWERVFSQFGWRHLSRFFRQTAEFRATSLKAAGQHGVVERLWKLCRPHSSHGRGLVAAFLDSSGSREHCRLTYPHIHLGRAVSRWLTLPHPQEVTIGAQDLQRWLLWHSAAAHPEDIHARMKALRDLHLLHTTRRPKIFIPPVSSWRQMTRSAQELEARQQHLEAKELRRRGLPDFLASNIFCHESKYHEDIHSFLLRHADAPQGFFPMSPYRTMTEEGKRDLMDNIKSRRVNRWANFMGNWPWLRDVVRQLIRETKSSLQPGVLEDMEKFIRYRRQILRITCETLDVQ